jgi:hypothetical protein
MIYVEEIPKATDYIPPAFATLETAQLRLKTEVCAAGSLGSPGLNELNLSASQVLVGFTSVFGALGLVLWAILKLWLFDQ